MRAMVDAAADVVDCLADSCEGSTPSSSTKYGYSLMDKATGFYPVRWGFKSLYP